MKVRLWGEWNQSAKKLSRENVFLAKEVLEFFKENPYHASLRNHPLDPPLEKYRSISLDDDLRILFRMIDPDTALFLKIGSHETIYTQI